MEAHHPVLAVDDTGPPENGSSGSSDSSWTSDEEQHRGERHKNTKKDVWRETSGARSDWLQRQIEMMRADLHSFEVDSEVGSPGWATPGFSVTFRDVSFSVEVPNPDDNRSKTMVPILESCSGHFEAGSLVALMGPSGCGKTTMLDILAKKKTTPHSGTVCLNGREVDSLYPRIAAYVDSSDTMPQHMTVREAVRFNFFLKGQVPAYKHFTADRIKELVDFHLELVGLLHVADTKIGGETVRGISSGQRRRVTLARGMATGVPLMFCDEPTSGLSSTDAELCMKVLRILTRKWMKTVVVVIHQPRVEVARLFDRLVLLTARPGRVVYDGPMAAARAYWEALGHPVPPDGNPTDHYLDTVTPDAPRASPDFFAQEYKRRLLPSIEERVKDALQNSGIGALEFLEAERRHLSIFGRMPPVRSSKFSTHICRQVRMVGERKIKLMVRDPVVLAMQVIAPVLEGIGLGFCFWDIAHKKPAGILVVSGWLNMLLMTILFGGFTGVPQLIEDRILMQKEISEALYSEWAHIAVAMVMDMVVTLVRDGLFTALMYAFSGLPWSHFGEFFMWVMLLGVTMDPIFKAAAAVSKDMQTATMIGLLFVLFVAVFNGIGFVTKNSAPSAMRPLLYIMPSSLVAEQVAGCLYRHDAVVWGTLQEFMGLEAGEYPWTVLLVCLTWFCTFNVVAAAALIAFKQVEK